MKDTQEKNQYYFPPEITCIKLDNEISLALESDPPVGNGEGYNSTPNTLIIDPYKTFTV